MHWAGSGLGGAAATVVPAASAAARLPSEGLDWKTLEARMAQFRGADVDWRKGKCALHIYDTDEDTLQIARAAYAMFMFENALAPAAFPSVKRMEDDVVAISLGLMNAPAGAAGNITTGGTESIILAVKAARDRHRGRRTRDRAQIILPETAHPAFHKAAHLLDIDVRRVPVGEDCRAAPDAIAAAISEQAAMIVVSAPCLPYGVIDPVEEVAKLARARGVWLHVDACIGGFLAPFVRMLGYPVPAFDFAVDGVRSMSIDLHKFGYAAKGASVILYASEDDRRSQGYEFAEWPKGRYFTPTLVGTKSGGAIAAAWAVMHHLGTEGYLARASRVMRLRSRYLEGICEIPGMYLIGRPDLSVIAFGSRMFDVFAVADELSKEGWYVSRVADPAALHQTITPAHASAVEPYLASLQRAAALVREGRVTAAVRSVATY